MDLVVVDASVVLKWLLPEADSEAALLVRKDHDLAAPDFLFVECRNVLLTKVRRRELELTQANEVESALEDIGASMAILPSLPLLRSAFTIGLELAEPIYDCIYLAAAIAINSKLITSDKRLATSVTRSRLGENRVMLLRSLRV